MRENLIFRAGEATVWQNVVFAAVRGGHSAAAAMLTADDVVMGLRARNTP